MNRKFINIIPAAVFMALFAVACGETATAPEPLQPEFAVMFNGSDIVPLNPAHVGATNSGFGVGECPTPPAGQEGWWGWHFLMPANNNFTSLTVTFQKAGTFTADPFPGTVFVAHPDNSHAYIWTPTDDTLLAGSATSSGSNAFFNLSHVCPGGGKTLEVSKTAVTSYTREHFWDIDKKVDTENGYEHDGLPKIWLYTDGSGDESATWTVDVVYEGYEDSGWNVSGTITIKNISNPAEDKVITAVEDVLAGTPITVNCGVTFPYTLPQGETLTCAYSEDGYVEGVNEVTVTTGGEQYLADAAIVWGAPTTEINKTVTVKDLSDLFGEVALGSVTAPNGAKFTYDKDFAWEGFGQALCGDYVYDNTASIVETGQDASATLKVNVQCFVYETAYAKGSAAQCFIPTFNQWGWTNPVTPHEYTWDLWAGAAQCDTSKGTLVGSVTVVYGADGFVEVTFNVDAPYSLDETHVYAGTTTFPQVTQGRNRTVSTVAPGQYYNASPFDGSSVWVIAHGVVGIPDPNFGP